MQFFLNFVLMSILNAIKTRTFLGIVVISISKLFNIRFLAILLLKRSFRTISEHELSECSL